MTQFKVGDRVRHVEDGDEGTVTELASSFGEDYVRVDFERDGIESVYDDLIELVEEQPNRSYYARATPPNAEERARVRELLEEKDSARDYDGNTPEQWEAYVKISSFATNVHRILDGVADTVIKKNASYGDSALNPIRVFSKADRMEQLFVRLDDKLSRVQRGSEYPGDDTLRDIIGYATLILIARESE